MAELNGGGVAAVLTADTAVERRVDFLAEFDSHLHELAYAVLVELRERIALEDLLIVVERRRPSRSSADRCRIP